MGILTHGPESAGLVPPGKMTIGECPNCGAGPIMIAAEETFKQIYPNWRESPTLKRLDRRDDIAEVCTNCGSYRTKP